MRIDVLSLFPEMIEGIMATSMMGRAQASGIIELHSHNLRDFTHDLHRTCDDAPYGGGGGMLMKVEPIFEAFDSIFDGKANPAKTEDTQVIFMTPRGEPLEQRTCNELASLSRLVLVCGHYEGFDERCFSLADRCISIGDYVLTGGELPAMVLADAVVRQIPGVLGNEESPAGDSYSDGLDGMLEYPQYTRPASYRGMDVPDVLLSGDHARIREWRKIATLETTKRLRPDLLR